MRVGDRVKFKVDGVLCEADIKLIKKVRFVDHEEQWEQWYYLFHSYRPVGKRKWRAIRFWLYEGDFSPCSWF